MKSMLVEILKLVMKVMIHLKNQEELKRETESPKRSLKTKIMLFVISLRSFSLFQIEQKKNETNILLFCLCYWFVYCNVKRREKEV